MLLIVSNNNRLHVIKQSKAQINGRVTSGGVRYTRGAQPIDSKSMLREFRVPEPSFVEGVEQRQRSRYTITTPPVGNPLIVDDAARRKLLHPSGLLINGIRCLPICRSKRQPRLSRFLWAKGKIYLGGNNLRMSVD